MQPQMTKAYMPNLLAAALLRCSGALIRSLMCSAKEKALDREIKGFPLKLVANQGFEPRTCGL